MTSEAEIHQPVLLAEVVRLFAEVPKGSGSTLVDGTVGLGGHAEGLLDADPAVRLLGIDRDTEALEYAASRLARFGERVRLVHGETSELPALLEANETVAGVLLDVGVSSLQLDRADRGFSFRADGPLDMRMDRSSGPTAADWIASVSEAELVSALRAFGEERYAGRIARGIVEARQTEPIETTHALRRVVHRAVPSRYFDGPIDPATRTFQAIRIAVNRELERFEGGLEAAFDALVPGGMLAVISFHSLEDRIVKRFLRTKAAACVCPPEIPECLCNKQIEAEILTRRPIVPTEAEVEANPRARSGKLRAARKVV